MKNNIPKEQIVGLPISVAANLCSGGGALAVILQCITAGKKVLAFSESHYISELAKAECLIRLAISSKSLIELIGSYNKNGHFKIDRINVAGEPGMSVDFTKE